MTVLVSQASRGTPPVVAPVTPTPGAPALVIPDLVLSAVLSSQGGSVDLTQAPFSLKVGTSGLTGAGTVTDIRVLPGVDGGYVAGESDDSAGMHFDPLDIVLVVGIDGDSPQDVSTLTQRVRHILNVRRYGPATLAVARWDGTERTIRVRHSPAVGDYDRDLALDSGIVLVRLVAPSPLWRGAPGVAGPWGLDAGAGGGSLPADLPFDLASSSVLGEANPVVVGGDELTWPTVTLRGPLDGVQATRTDPSGRGRSYALLHPTGLPAGQMLTIRHDPSSLLSGARQIEGPGGESWARYLFAGADLFELRPGPQALRLIVSGAGPGAEAWVEWPTLHWSGID